MSFQWPEFLWLGAALPLLVALYFYLLRRKKKFAVRYSSLVLLKEAMRGPNWRRHVPPFLLATGLALLIVAIARPSAVMTLPSQQETVILAMDVSGSMRASDVEPNRLAAAQAAAKAFIGDQPSHVRNGIVAFAGTATVAQAPTTNKDDLYAAIDRFQLQRATAIGSAIIVSLAVLFPDGGYDVASYSYAAEKKKPPPNFKPVPPGSYGSAVIILLTDGQRTTGPDSLLAARLAAERGVRIFTVGVGTPEGKIVGFDGWSMHVRLDEETLRAIADLTRGDYFYAGNAVDLKKIYQTMNSRLVMETKKTEIGAFFSAAAALLVLIAGLLSLAGSTAFLKIGVPAFPSGSAFCPRAADPLLALRPGGHRVFREFLRHGRRRGRGLVSRRGGAPLPGDASRAAHRLPYRQQRLRVLPPGAFGRHAAPRARHRQARPLVDRVRGARFGRRRGEISRETQSRAGFARRLARAADPRGHAR